MDPDAVNAVASDSRFIVRGERVGLSAPCEEEFVARWPLFNDAQMMMVAMRPVASPGTPGFVSMPPVNRRQRERMWESFVTIRAMLPFDIWDIQQDRVVGEILLDAIQWPHATCELMVWLFDPADRGRGLGSEATRLIVAYAFDGLGLHRVCIRFLAVNPAVVGAVTRWAESFGAREYGRERESVFAFGGYQDVIMFDLLRHEFPPHPATALLRGAPSPLSEAQEERLLRPHARG
jgi:diamine N-acetyltransferase